MDALSAGRYEQTGVVEMLDSIQVNRETWYVSTCVLTSATERQHSLLLKYERVSSGRVFSSLVQRPDRRGNGSKPRFVFNAERLQGLHM